jgi:hypothetical protein
VGVLYGVAVFGGTGVSEGARVSVGSGVSGSGIAVAFWVGTTMVSLNEGVERGTGVSKLDATVANLSITSVAAGSSSNITSRITLTSTTGMPGVAGSAE